MKDTVIKINILRDCVHTTELKLHGDRIGVDGLASIRRSLRLKKGHKVTPQMFYLDRDFASFNGLKPVMFIDDNIKEKFDDIYKLRTWGTILPMESVTLICREMRDADVHIFGNVIICLKDKNTGRLVGMNKEQVADIMSVIKIKDGGVDPSILRKK